MRKINIMEVEELNMLIDIQKYDYYILVDQNIEEPEENKEDSEDNNSIVTNKLETNQKLIAEVVKNYSEQRRDEEQVVLSDISLE